MWASSTLTSSRSGRLVGASSTLAWMMLTGMIVATPVALITGPIPAITPELTLWAAGSGIGSVLGLMLVYRGLRFGKVGVVAALASTEGAIAAVIAVAAGEPMTIPIGLMLVVIVGGIATVALAANADEPDQAGVGEGVVMAPRAVAAGADPKSSAAPIPPAGASASGARTPLTAERKAAIYGALSAICFGVAIYSTAKLGSSMSPIAAVLPARFVGVVGVFIPLALAGRLRLTRRAAPMVIWIGIAEVLGNASYVVGASQSIAISAVLASQFAAVAAVSAFVIFGERLSGRQRSGVVAIAVGVALLTLAKA
jgi:drug/metabolite transporter (DMT)-like permease